MTNNNPQPQQGRPQPQKPISPYYSQEHKLGFWSHPVILSRIGLIIMLVGCVLFGAVVCGGIFHGNGDSGRSEFAPSTTSSSARKDDNGSGSKSSSKPSKTTESFDIGSLDGKTVYEAHDLIVKSGLTFKAISDGDVSKTDITEDFYNGDGSRIDGWDDWKVVSATQSGNTITCMVDSQENLDAEKKTAENEKAGDAAAPAVMTACQNEGENRFPYGYKEHDILGVIQDVIRQDDGSFYYKVKATVTNEYNARQEVTVECVTTGNNDSQTVTSWNAY